MLRDDGHSETAARAVLKRHYGLADAGRATLRIATGGMSRATIWRVAVGSEQWALRRWPAPSDNQAGWDAAAVARIHRVLNHAVDRGIDYVPAPVQADDGATLVELAGAVWELAPWLPGEPSCPDDGRSEGRLAAAATALARFHAATDDLAPPQAVTPCPAIVERAARLRVAQATDWASIARDAIRDREESLRPLLSETAALIPPALARASSAIDSVASLPSPVQPVVRDARREHFLFVDERVTGLIDFGAMRVDSPAVDFARLLGEWASDDPRLWRLGLEHGQLDEPSRRLVGPLDASGVVLAACNWLTWAGQGSEVPGERLRWLAARLRGLAESGSPAPC